MINQGVLITFEGGEGVGKTTQVARLKKRFEAIGKTVVVLREPGGTVISEQIRETVLTVKNTGLMLLTTEVLLFQAARAQIYGELVLPALAEGKIVLMDRSRDSSVVYQGVVRGFGKKIIERLNNISTQKTVPNLTLLLDAPVSVGIKRRMDVGDGNRLDNEKNDFHEGVRAGYLALAAENHHNRWKVVDATASIEAVEAELWRLISKKLKLT